jgi:hypothetical protein
MSAKAIACQAMVTACEGEKAALLKIAGSIATGRG